MNPENRRDYDARFRFAAGPEIPASSDQHIEIDPCEDFALMALTIRASDATLIEDFRTVLYNCGLEVENQEGKMEIQTPLTALTSTSPALPTEGMPLIHFAAGETVQLRIVYDPDRPSGKRVSAPLEITIGLHGMDRKKKKKKPKKQTARKKRAAE